VSEAAREIARPEGGRRQLESERKRQRILESARRCFGEMGFAGATVAAIAADAGVSNGLLYQFFRNKEHLFSVVLEEVIRDWVRAMVPRDEKSAKAALETMFRRSVEFCRSHPLLPALVTGDRSLQLGRIGNVGAERVSAHRELVASILRRGIASGEFRADLEVEHVADLICQLQADYSSRAYRRDPRYPADPQLIDAAVHFIDQAVRAG
jgi:TetR/AcrR family transcriptional regulator